MRQICLQYLTSSLNDICNITRTTDAIVFTLFSNFLLIQILTWLHIGFCGIELSWIYLKISLKDQRKLKVWKISKLLSYKCFLLFCVSSLQCLLPDEPASEGPIQPCNRSKKKCNSRILNILEFTPKIAYVATFYFQIWERNQFS